LGNLVLVLRAYRGGLVFGELVGDSPPAVVLLHGWRRSHQDFAALAQGLHARGVSSLALDLPGFGASPPPTVATGASGYADNVATLLRELGGPPTVLVGHSFGGRVATVLAATYPELVSHVVLTGVPLLRTGSGATSPLAYRLLRRGARWRVVSPARLEKARQRYGSADYRAANGVMRDVLVTVVNEEYSSYLSEFRVGLDLVWGANDTVVPPDVARRAQLLVTGSHLHVVEGVSHLLPSEAPDTLLEPLLKVLGA
jgi:pimeloyl-ACP methyl ester carboxylesterase